MAEEIVEVTLSSNFYRDSYQKLLTALLISATVIVFLVGVLVYLFLNPPEAKYFAVDTDKRIIPLVPLDAPNLSQAALLQWANTAAISAYTYNFVNYQAALTAAADYFTPEGWAAFRAALSDSGNLEDVIAKKLIVSAVATGAPVILDQGKLDNVYTWRVQIPLLVTYQSASQFSQQTLTISMLITRVSSLDSAKGVGIAQFSVSGGA
jgi:intracellular multiplication protein IcmL